MVLQISLKQKCFTAKIFFYNIFGSKAVFSHVIEGVCNTPLHKRPFPLRPLITHGLPLRDVFDCYVIIQGRGEKLLVMKNLLCVTTL